MQCLVFGERCGRMVRGQGINVLAGKEDSGAHPTMPLLGCGLAVKDGRQKKAEISVNREVLFSAGSALSMSLRCFLETLYGAGKG